MAAKKSESGGGAAVAMPEGFTPGREKFYGECVAARFDAAPRMASVRLALVGGKGTTDEQVRELLSNPRLQLKKKAPGVWEVNARVGDMESTIDPQVGADRMFRFVDLASRIFGATFESPTDTASVAVAYDGSAADAKKKLKALGMTVSDAKPAKPEPGPGEEDVEPADPDEGLMTGTVPAGKLGDMLLDRKVLAIAVRG